MDRRASRSKLAEALRAPSRSVGEDAEAGRSRMSKPFGPWLALALCAALAAAAAPAHAQDDDEALGFERTPPRLSFADGEVSFWRSGAEDWTPAHVNTALAAGDELYA